MDKWGKIVTGSEWENLWKDSIENSRWSCVHKFDNSISVKLESKSPQSSRGQGPFGWKRSSKADIAEEFNLGQACFFFVKTVLQRSLPPLSTIKFHLYTQQSWNKKTLKWPWPDLNQKVNSSVWTNIPNFKSLPLTVQKLLFSVTVTLTWPHDLHMTWQKNSTHHTLPTCRITSLYLLWFKSCYF